jgi:TetR/AcrR family acrAB operon transcriptional repressor
MPRNTKEEALETRNRILDAAENVFYEKGVAHTSLDDIAKAASVTRGAIYWHFKNKSDLFTAMCDRVHVPMEQMAQANADESLVDPLGDLRKGCIFFLKDAVSNPHSRKVFEILFHKCEFVESNEAISTKQRECFLRGTATIECILRNVVAKGQLPADLDIPLAANLLHATLDGLLNNWLFTPSDFDLAVNAERLVDACIDNLRNASTLRKQV